MALRPPPPLASAITVSTGDSWPPKRVGQPDSIESPPIVPAPFSDLARELLHP